HRSVRELHRAWPSITLGFPHVLGLPSPLQLLRPLPALSQAPVASFCPRRAATSASVVSLSLDTSKVSPPSVRRNVFPFLEISRTRVPGARPTTPDFVTIETRSVKKKMSGAGCCGAGLSVSLAGRV